jgi:peptidoglycan/LPS O-acetylase OafA/YrhL
MASAPARKIHVPALDGLRGIAVLLVLWTHVPVGTFGPLHEVIKGLVRPGYLGVDLFFVLSGFLITRILVADRDSDAPLRWFWFRRCLRIFPIYYLLLAVLWFVAYGPEWPWCAAYFGNYYFLSAPLHAPGAEASALRHTWSLSIEEHFYLLWPLVVYRFRTQRGLVRAASVLLVLALATAALPLCFAESRVPLELARRWIYESSTTRATSLLLGALIALHEAPLRAFAPQRGRWLALLLCASVAAILASRWAQLPGTALQPWRIWPLVDMLAYAAFSASLLLASTSLLLATRSAGRQEDARPDNERDAVQPSDARKGDARKGDARKGDARKGDARKGDARQSDARQSDARQSDARKGDAPDGDAAPGRPYDGGFARALFANAPLRWVGRISYGLYLYHLPIFHAFGMVQHRGDQPASAGTVCKAVALSFAVAWLSFHALERPLLALQTRFRRV